MTNGETGMVRREEFGAHQVERRGENAITAAAAQAKAQVEAMYIVAMNRPRDMMLVRDKLVKECKRKGFAETAEYALPRGGKTIRGPSIRFAEAAARALTNLHIRTSITYEDDERRVGEVTVIDLEANLPYTGGFTIDKTVERKSPPKGAEILSQRVNSSGETVYRVAGTEADVLQKQEATCSKIIRNMILRILPGDLVDEAIAQCQETIQAGDAKDPGATAKKMVDGFASLGIGVAQLRDFLGHNVDGVTPEEAANLRGIYAALKDGQTSWSEIIEAKRSGGDNPPPLTSDEKTERAGHIKTLATARVKDPTAYDAALKAAGVASGIAAHTLPMETLRKVAVALAPKPGAPAGPALTPTQEAEKQAAEAAFSGDPKFEDIPENLGR